VNQADTLEYIGPEEVCEATIATVQPTGAELRAELLGTHGEHVVIVFSGVAEVFDKRPVGMKVRRLKKYTHLHETHFELENWDELDDRQLAVTASGLSIEVIR
jgi:hypothetical protein